MRGIPCLVACREFSRAPIRDCLSVRNFGPVASGEHFRKGELVPDFGDYPASARIRAARAGKPIALIGDGAGGIGGDGLGFPSDSPVSTRRHSTKSAQKTTPRTTGKPRARNHSRAVEYEMPAKTANSLALSAWSRRRFSRTASKRTPSSCLSRSIVGSGTAFDLERPDSFARPVTDPVGGFLTHAGSVVVRNQSRTRKALGIAAGEIVPSNPTQIT